DLRPPPCFPPSSGKARTRADCAADRCAQKLRRRPAVPVESLPLRLARGLLLVSFGPPVPSGRISYIRCRPCSTRLSTCVTYYPPRPGVRGFRADSGEEQVVPEPRVLPFCGKPARLWRSLAQNA